MSRKEKRRSGPGTWKYSAGRRPHTVTAYERPEKANTVWLRWNRPGTGLFEKMSIGIRLRDDDGCLVEKKVKIAQERAKRTYDRLLRGENPKIPEPELDEKGQERLTIEKGLSRALSVPAGMFAVESEHARDMRRYAGHLSRVIAPTLTWDGLTANSYQEIWRMLAQLKKDEGVGGRRSCELAIVLLAQAGRWLHRGRHVGQVPAEPESGYVQKLHADWDRITKEPRSPQARPRYTQEELGRLLLHLDDERADPRIRLAFRLAGEGRLGQAVQHCRRSHLDLGPVGAYQLGRFTVPDVVKKKGIKVDLTPELRRSVERELSAGYLSRLEEEYLAGQLKTYCLFPGGKLVRGVSRGTGAHPLGRRAATDLWHEFEQIAGVAVIEGRGWYAARRTGADLAEDVESDSRALNALTGHESDEMRRKIYQEKERDQILAKASVARDAARQVAITAARAATMPPVGTAPLSKWELNREAKRARRAAAHAEQRTEKRRPASYPLKACASCGVDFQPSGPNTRACASCSPRRVRAKPRGD
jgi:hypothetical protein